MMRILGIDYGDALIGLALSDASATLCGRAWTLTEWNLERAVAAIADVVRTEGVERIVLGLPKNMVRAAENIVNGNDFACDVGSFNEDVFVYIAAFGLFTDVSYETGQDMKNVLGHMAYLLEGMKRLSAIRSYPMRITYEDTTIVDDFIFGMVTNSVSVGGFKRITGKNVKLDDGVFEVTLIKRPKNPIELNNIMVSLLNRDIDTDAMYCFRTSKVEITSAEPLPWTLDGEYGGTHTKVVIENICRGVDIRVEQKES